MLTARGAMSACAVGNLLMLYAFISELLDYDVSVGIFLFETGCVLTALGSVSIYSFASIRSYRGLWEHYVLTASAIISNILTGFFILLLYVVL